MHHLSLLQLQKCYSYRYLKITNQFKRHSNLLWDYCTLRDSTQIFVSLSTTKCYYAPFVVLFISLWQSGLNSVMNSNLFSLRDSTCMWLTSQLPLCCGNILKSGKADSKYINVYWGGGGVIFNICYNIHKSFVRFE